MDSAQAFRFDLSGGRLCLDFANTVSDRTSGQPIERLKSVADLLAFSRQSVSAGADDVEALRRLAARHPDRGDAVLARARALRETLFRLFLAVARGQAAPRADVAALNAALPETLTHLQLVPAPGGFAWDWIPEAALDRALWPVLRDAAELLTSGALASVRECAAETCSWLFLDQSKNQSRRWCDMKVCGNRTKARRHYLRSRGLA